MIIKLFCQYTRTVKGSIIAAPKKRVGFSKKILSLLLLFLLFSFFYVNTASAADIGGYESKMDTEGSDINQNSNKDEEDIDVVENSEKYENGNVEVEQSTEVKDEKVEKTEVIIEESNDNVTDENGKEEDEKVSEEGGESSEEESSNSEKTEGVKEEKKDDPNEDTNQKEQNDDSEQAEERENIKIDGNKQIFYDIETDKLYSYFKNDKVSIQFLQLDEDIDKPYLSIEEKLGLEVKGRKNITGYEIKSNMNNGSFVYNLTLPSPSKIKEDLKVYYSEDGKEYLDVNQEHTVKQGKIQVNGLNHFTVYVVIDTTTDCPVGTTPGGDCFETIQDAIDAADPTGEDIVIAPGTYSGAGNFNVNVDKPVSIIGDVLDPSTTEVTCNGNLGNGFNILSSNVVIEGITIRDCDGISSSNQGMGVNAPSGVSDVIVRNNVFINNNWADVFVWTDRDVPGNPVHSDWLIENNVVQKGPWSNNTNVYGIECTGCVNSTIRRNTITGGYTGLLITTQGFGSNVTSGNIFIEGNTVTGSEGPNGNLNLVSWSTDGNQAILQDITVHGNTFSNSQNGIRGYTLGGGALGGTFDVTNCNQFINNTNNGILNQSDIQWNGTGNWWNDPSGPSGQGTGSGDAISSDVTYAPWSINRECTQDSRPENPLFWVEENTTQVRVQFEAVEVADLYRIYVSSDGGATFIQEIEINNASSPAWDPCTLNGNIFTCIHTPSGNGNGNYYYKVTSLLGGIESDPNAINIEAKYAGLMDIVIDNDGRGEGDFNSSGSTSSTGAWRNWVAPNEGGSNQVISNAVGGDVYGTGSRFEGQTHTWNTNATLDGEYEVYVQYICNYARGVADYQIWDGSTLLDTVSINQSLLVDQQTQCGNQSDSNTESMWVLLGSYDFTTGNSGTIVMIAPEEQTGIVGNVLADAVGFRWVNANLSQVTVCKENNFGTRLNGWTVYLQNQDTYESLYGITRVNGCVVFVDMPYGSYLLDEILQDGWEKVSGIGVQTIDQPEHLFILVNREVVTPQPGIGIEQPVQPSTPITDDDSTKSTVEMLVDTSANTSITSMLLSMISLIVMLGMFITRGVVYIRNRSLQTEQYIDFE